MSLEVAHYVVTAYPPGGILCAAKCNFLDESTQLLVIAKSQRLEFRSIMNQETESSSHVVLSLPINGRITNLIPVKLPQLETSLLFFMTETFHYAVIGSAPGQTPYPVQTLASGHVHPSLLGQRAEGSPRVAYHPHVMAMHLYDGFLTLVPIHSSSYQVAWDHATKKGEGRLFSSQQQLMGEPYHLRLEENHLLDLKFVENYYSHSSEKDSQQIALLHQDARGSQHVVVYTLRNRQLSLCWKKQRLDGASCKLLSLPPPTSAFASTTSEVKAEQKHKETGSIVVLGQRQITHLIPGKQSRVIALPQSLILTSCPLSDSRFLLGDEFGQLHVLTVTSQDMSLDTLGSSVLASALVYLHPNFIFCGSQLGDSQLLQLNINVSSTNNIMDEESSNTPLSLLQEYTNLGPILDMDWVETTPQQHSVVTASGSSFSGSLRLVRNGIGMKEFASVGLPGIQQMFNLRANYQDWHDTYLVQSYVTETRILGVLTANNNDDTVMQDTEEEEEGATLEEVVLQGLNPTSSSLYVGNVEEGNLVLQITPRQVLLIDVAGGRGCVSTWVSETDIAVAAANEAGQIVIALRGGILMYLKISPERQEIKLIGKTHLTSEVSCLDVNPFSNKATSVETAMETDVSRDSALSSSIVTVGLWDDFTVRVLKLDAKLNQILEIHLSNDEEGESKMEISESISNATPANRRNRNNMMARSLCLVTLDSTTTNNINHNGTTTALNSVGVDMLFVGLGDGTLISFSVITGDDGLVSVRSKKEVSLGTQRIQLVPLETERGGTCVLATGDRPTVIYLAGSGGGGSTSGARHTYTPKLCYSNVNLSSPNPASEEDPNLEPQQLTERSIAVNVATPFVSPQLFEDSTSSSNQSNNPASKHYSLCVSDDAVLRLGVIDDIQKLHVTTCRLGMAPRRVVHYERLFCVGCIESGIASSSDDEANMGNCVRFLDDATLDDVERIDMEPHEMILSMAGVQLTTSSVESSSSNSTTLPTTESFLVVGTAYVLPDEDEPTSGRILVFSSCVDPHHASLRQEVKLVTELQVRGGVYSICQFYDGLLLVTVNSKTRVCRLISEGSSHRIEFLGVGHHGHILSLMVKSRAQKQTPNAQLDTTQSNKMDDATPTKKKKKAIAVKEEEQLAIVGDLMRSISLVQYYPDHKALEEVARDFHSNWTTAVEMLTDSLYLGAENWNNLYILRRNAKATSEEIKCRLDTVGQFHLGESVNKFISGSLTMAQTSSASSSTSSSSAITRRNSPSKMGGKESSSLPSSTSSSSLRVRRPVVKIGSQTLFASVDGTLGSILGLDARTAAFFTTMERAMAKHVTPVGNLSHSEFRTFSAERRIHPAQGFIDGDLVESFLDMDRNTMRVIVQAMNRDGGWEIEQHDPNKKLEHEDESADLESSHAQQQQQLLTVEDVVAMVEEMTMLH